MNRLYVIEPTPTTTGGMADHRRVVRVGEIERLARIVAGEAPAANDSWIQAVIRDLQAHRGASIVLVGDEQPAAVHALVHAINHALGNVGKTVVYTENVAAQPVNQIESLRELVKDMETGRVEVLVVVGGNPVYNAPADFGFASAMEKVKFRARLGLYEDETSRLCHWHIPEAHYLETWSDARAFDGTITIQQPLIAPLYDGKSPHELVAAFLNHPDHKSHDSVRAYWKMHGLADDNLWQAALHDGVVPGTAFKPKSVKLLPQNATGNRPSEQATGLEIIFRPDPGIWDGRFANNGWLQELPRPVTRLTWDNAVLISPVTAEKLGVTNEDVVELRLGEQSVRGPVWIVPGQADETVVVTLGYGRTRVGRVGNDLGFNAYRLRSSNRLWFGGGLEIRKTGQRYALSCTQNHQTMEGRDLVRVQTREEFLKNPSAAHNEVDQPSLYPGHEYDGYKWGMTIDLTACIGCSACVVACQSENNIPVVGKDQVARGREMHWIRIDRYFTGELDSPEIVFEPVPCMHCENAPCELVCPGGGDRSHR